MDKLRLILASKSPRRREILERAGFHVEILPSDVPEDDLVDLRPVDHVRTLSRRKAEAIRFDGSESVIIGADTIVSLDQHILEKPRDEEDAFRMLSALSGRTHDVYTGITLIHSEGDSVSDAACTKVTFRSIDAWEIRDYVRSGGPMDKAGAYGIQEYAGLFVESIQGCYFNVVGFPLSLFFRHFYGMIGSEGVRQVRHWS